MLFLKNYQIHFTYAESFDGSGTGWSKFSSHWIIWDVGRSIARGGLHIVEDAPASETSTYGSVSRPPPAEMLTSGLGSKFSTTLFSLLFP